MHEYRFRLPTRLAIAVAAMVLAVPSWCRGDDAPATDFFESRIRPVLARHCYQCHSHAVADPKGGLRLDSREAIRAGGESGPAVVPGDAWRTDARARRRNGWI